MYGGEVISRAVTNELHDLIRSQIDEALLNTKGGWVELQGVEGGARELLITPGVAISFESVPEETAQVF